MIYIKKEKVMTNCRECWDDGYLWTHPSGSEDDKPRFEKCDACGIFKDDNEAHAKAQSRQYYVVWWNGYNVNSDGCPHSSHIRHEDINESNGWHDEDVDEISSLSIGEKCNIDGPIERVTVFRWK
jgi:hypothetical protein